MAALTEDGSKSVETVVLPDGEQFKSLEVLQAVWDRALSTRLDRKCTFLALGGGVIGDMTGFAAACYQRGVHFLQVRREEVLCGVIGRPDRATRKIERAPMKRRI